jgi:hypothetical protein
MLPTVQKTLEEIYELQLDHCINDFLITTGAVVEYYDRSANPRSLQEKLLVQQHGEELGISLFLEAELLRRLEDQDPFTKLDADNFRDFMFAVEGVSHFVCLAWHATFDKQISLLELELQAEIDKFVLAARLLARQQGAWSFQGLHELLFTAPVFDDRLLSDELDRYRTASRYAAKFCQHLRLQVLRTGREHTTMMELRRFYRLPKLGKLARITQLLP